MSNFSEIEEKVELAKTEAGEKGAVQRIMRANGHQSVPAVTQGRSPDGRLVRMYLWRSSPFGHVCLVTGPDIDASVHELSEVEAGDELGDIYFPAQGRAPALSNVPVRRSNRGAPGYRSWSWTQEDWRTVKVSRAGDIDYTQKCGAHGTKTHSGKPRLCLPLKAIQRLMRSEKGREELRKQARSKARAPKGKKVPYLPLVNEAVRIATKDSPPDVKRNPHHSLACDHGEAAMIDNPGRIPFLSLKTVKAAIPFMEAEGVSDVARSPRGFIAAYTRAKGRSSKAALGTDGYSGQSWLARRNAFVKRHVAQMDGDGWEGGQPTRRHLALVAWAYSPTPERLRRWIAASSRKANPGVGDGGTAIVRGGPSAPVKYLEKKGLLRSPVLDFGSGHGEDAAWLRSKGYQVREYDPNFEGVDKLPTGTYNTVLVTYVLNVLPSSEEPKLLRQIRARLRKGGDAFITVRGDIDKAGETSRGYQRPVELDAELLGRPGGSPVFVMEKSPRSNPQARVGKVRKRADGSEYVLWRPVLEDGSRPRIYLDASEPGIDAELVDVMEAEEQLKAGKKVIERKLKAAKKKGKRGIFSRGTGRRIVSAQKKTAPLARANTKAPLFDSEGNEYEATYQVIPVNLDGTGPVFASNLPFSFEPTPGYPPPFQARSLQRLGETRKIEKIAKDLDPDRVLLPHADATFGTPVVWEGEDGYYVLGGNGRTIALLMAPTDRYQAYVARGRALWPDVWPRGGSPAGTRNILVRTVTKADGSDLSFAQARTLAGRTQKAASGEESPIGKALSLIRSLGIETVSDLPRFIWKGIITQDNVEEFQAVNNAFAGAIYDSMGKARAESYQQDPALLAQLFNDIMVGYLPRRFQLAGFVSEKQERALLSALPIVVSIHQGTQQGDVQDKWDLFPLLDAASRFSQAIKNKSDSQAIRMVEMAASQVQFGEGTQVGDQFRSLFDELPILAVLFGLVLKKAEKARDPAITVEKYLLPYAETAFSASESAVQSGLFAAPGAPDAGQDPAELLSRELGISLPRRIRETEVRQAQLIANRRANRKGQLRLRRAGSRILEHLYARGPTAYAAKSDGKLEEGVLELLEKGLAESQTCTAADQTVYGRETCTVRLTKRGKDFAKNRRRAERTHQSARQGRLFNPSSDCYYRRQNEGRREGHIPGADSPGPPGTQLGLFGGVYGGRPDENPDTAPKGRLTILNMGLGRDSLTMLCLLAKGELMAEGRLLGPEDVDAVVFSDTGNEWKHTYDLIPRVEAYAEKHGIRFLHLKKPQAGTETGELMDDWLEAMKAARAERESGWWDVYKNTVQPRYQELARQHDLLRAEKDKTVRETRKNLKALGYSTDEINVELKKIRERYNLQIKEEKAEAKAWAANLKKEGGFAGKAERAWWAPKDEERREMFDTIEARAEAGVYHLRPDLLVDFAWKGTIPLRSDKSCTGNHKVAPIRKVTEDLAIEKFGPWATNTGWGNEVGKGTRRPHLNLIGLAADETDRLEKGGDIGCFNVRYVTEAYPLAEMGIAKADEQRYLDECGFGDTRKSGCWSCPFQPIGWWWALSVLHPDKFEQAVRAEDAATQRDPKLFYTGAKAQGRQLSLPEAVANWRSNNPDADPEEVLDKQYAKCAVKFQAPKKNPEVVDSCCPECNRFVDKWLEFGIPEWLGRVQYNPRRWTSGPPGNFSSWSSYYEYKLSGVDRAMLITEDAIRQMDPERANMPGGQAAYYRTLQRNRMEILEKLARARSQEGDSEGARQILNMVRAQKKKTNPEEEAVTQVEFDFIGRVPVLHFASGSNSPGEIRGFADIGKAVGAAFATVNRKAKRWSRLCGKKCMVELKAAMERGVPVFLDSGAFSEVVFRGDGPPVVDVPIPAESWEERFDAYRELARAGKGLANVVAPDKVGFQRESFERLARYREQVNELLDMGATVLVPLQLGELTLAEAHGEVDQILGRRDWTPALPFQNAATTPQQLREYLAAVKPSKVHLLGIGPERKIAPQIADAVRSGSPSTQLQMDSVIIKRHVGRKRRKTGDPRGLITRAQDDATDALRYGRYMGAYTDDIGEPSDWATNAALKRLAGLASLTRAERAELAENPDEFFQRTTFGGQDFGLPFYELFSPQIEAEYAKVKHDEETFERKRRGIVEGIGHLYSEPQYIRNRGENYFDTVGPLGAPLPGQRGYRPAPEYGNAFGGIRPLQLADYMMFNAERMMGEPEFFWAFCQDNPELEGCWAQETEEGEVESLADLVEVPRIGGDGAPLSELDRSDIAYAVVQTVMETDPSRWQGMDIQIGEAKSRKGPTSKIIARRGRGDRGQDFGEVPVWAARAMLADWLTGQIPDYRDRLRIVNVSKEEAELFIQEHHSALPYINARGLLFALGLMKGDRLVAVATVNTPTGNWSREPRVKSGELAIDDILELTRVASDGSTKGAASKLVGRIIDVMQIGKRGDPNVPALLVTYQLESESGTTYKALSDKGLRPVARTKGKKPTGTRKGSGDDALAQVDKIRWECCTEPPALRGDWELVKQRQTALFNPKGRPAVFRFLGDAYDAGSEAGLSASEWGFRQSHAMKGEELGLGKGWVVAKGTYGNRKYLSADGSWIELEPILREEPRQLRLLNPQSVQSLVFDSKAYTPRTAAKWATEHGYSANKVHSTSTKHRIRQTHPGKFRRGSFRTIELGNGIQAVVAKRK